MKAPYTYRSASIRSKIIIVTIASIVVFAAILYIISSEVLRESYVTLEEESVLEDLSRVEDALQNTVSQINVKLSDWAAWDDTYRFVQDGNEEYVKSNLGVPSIALLKINMMVFSNAAGDVVFARAIDLAEEKEIESDSIKQFILSHKALSVPAGIDTSMSGILSLPEGPLLFATQPVVTSERQGPVQGTIIFGAFLDANAVESLAKLTHLAVTAYPYHDPSSPVDVTEAERHLLAAAEHFTAPLSGDSIAAYKVLYDFLGKPVLTLKIETPRDIYNQGRFAFYTFAITSSVLIVLFGAILIMLLDHQVIARFIRLSERVKEMGEKDDLSLRVDDDTHDEIGMLASSINSMIDKIAASKDAEKKSSEAAYGASEELKRHFEEVEQINKLMVDRELRMAELKAENERLRRGER